MTMKIIILKSNNMTQKILYFFRISIDRIKIFLRNPVYFSKSHRKILGAGCLLGKYPLVIIESGRKTLYCGQTFLLLFSCYANF